MAVLVGDAGGENEEKEGGNNRGWEDQLDQALAVGTHSTLAHLVDRIRRRQQRCVRHFCHGAQ